MKITKRQLRNIVEKRLLKEGVASMSHYESITNRTGLEIAGLFAEDMRQLFWDPSTQDSGMFADVEEDEWFDQVDTARLHLVDAIAAAIEQEIEGAEISLHDGAYMRRRS